MREITQTTEARPPLRFGRIASLAVALGALSATFGLGAINSAQAVASRTTNSAYSGGQMMAADPNGGFWTVTGTGAISAFDGAPIFGSPALSGVRPVLPIVGMEATPSGGGYWLVASDGGIFSFGDAQFHGSTGAIHLNKPIVGMAATPSGKGYWLVATDGGIFSFGDAQFHGSTGAIHLNKPIVGMAATSDGSGYWMVASDGGIFGFGDAPFFGSTGAIHLTQPIVGMLATPDGGGYWLVASDGGIFGFGDAPFYGSLGGSGQSVAGMIVNPSTAGYTLVATDGTPSAFTPSLASSSPAVTPPAVTPPAVTPPVNSSLLQGAYAGGVNPAGVTAFGASTGTHPTIASDYLPGSSGWAGMDGAGGSLSWMLGGGWAGSGYTLSLGVPIIPTDSNGTPMGTLAQGATGAYNNYYVTLAQTLIAGGESNAYLRLGWEFDGNWYTWAASTPAAEASYAAYFRQIVTAMRSVAGANFRFVWNPDASAFTTQAVNGGYDVSLAYPGKAYVDDIAIDVYDQSWANPMTPTNVWNQTTLPTLVASQQFAAAQGVPLAVTEWGVAIRSDGHGLGDDPLFVNNMISWMKNPANNVAFESYFNFDVTGQVDAINDGNFTLSLAAFTAGMA
ncbi:MAG TPA: glycosyl hydrolase [Acidimicrobiales bacterium]|nr:glycosyl hydrolase [Acidimicrobiales bacterium]